MSDYKRYTYDSQAQVDKCLECEKSVSECNVCSANPTVKHKVRRADLVAELWKQGKSDMEIAKALGISIGVANAIRRELGLNSNYKLDRTKIKAMWERGMKDAEIAEALGSTARSIRQIRSNCGFTKRRKRK